MAADRRVPETEKSHVMHEDCFSTLYETIL